MQYIYLFIYLFIYRTEEMSWQWFLAMEEKKKKKALSPPSSSSTMAIIHEKQHLQLCLLHALNNLFQVWMYTHFFFILCMYV